MRISLALAFLALAACGSAEESPSDAAGSAVLVADVVSLRYEPRFVLDKVLERKTHAFDEAKPIPEIRFASQVTLTEFQDALEAQWGFRPDRITNAYSVARNTIYLMDDAAYYAQHGRCIDDSLAHELTHYYQVVYRGWPLDGADDFIEFDAIEVQRWFRETYCAAP